MTKETHLKILFLSKEGDGLGIAHRLKTEGNDVEMFIQSKDFKLSGRGLVKQVSAWRPRIADADLIICDMVGFGRHEQLLRKTRAMIFGCSEMADLIELDRAKGMELFRKFNIDTPETYEFSSPEDAKQIAELWEPPGFVIKPNGNLDTGKTYVCRDKETYLWALSTLDSSTSMIVQKIIVGVEVSTEGWFNGRDWISPFNHTFEEKKFLVGDLGPNTGCMGNVVVKADGDKLVDETVKKLTPFMKAINYRGPIDINCIVNQDQLYGLEITARLGYDAIEALLEGLQESATDLFFETAAGIKKDMALSSDYMIAVRASVPPWPHGKPDDERVGMPILGLNEFNLKHVFLTDIYQEDDTYLYAGGDGVVLKATAHGLDIQTARNRVYRTLNNISIQDVQYRTDIGSRVMKDINLLKEWGWINA